MKRTCLLLAALLSLSGVQPAAAVDYQASAYLPLAVGNSWSTNRAQNSNRATWNSRIFFIWLRLLLKEETRRMERPACTREHNVSGDPNAGYGLLGIDSLMCSVSLFDEDHFAHLGDWTGLQPIQIHAAGDVLATMVAAIPMGGAGARQVLTRRAIAQVDFSD